MPSKSSVTVNNGDATALALLQARANVSLTRANLRESHGKWSQKTPDSRAGLDRVRSTR